MIVFGNDRDCEEGLRIYVSVCLEDSYCLFIWRTVGKLASAYVDATFYLLFLQITRSEECHVRCFWMYVLMVSFPPNASLLRDMNFSPTKIFAFLPKLWLLNLKMHLPTHTQGYFTLSWSYHIWFIIQNNLVHTSACQIQKYACWVDPMFQFPYTPSSIRLMSHSLKT